MLYTQLPGAFHEVSFAGLNLSRTAVFWKDRPMWIKFMDRHKDRCRHAYLPTIEIQLNCLNLMRNETQ